jgi:hypothetical protein
VIDIHVFENDLQHEMMTVKLPAVPRQGETITLPDAHYIIDRVCWQAHQSVVPPQGYEWPDTVYYTIRMVVRKKVFPDD